MGATTPAAARGSLDVAFGQQLARLTARSTELARRWQRPIDIVLWTISGVGYLIAAATLIVFAHAAVEIHNGAPVITGGAAGWDSYSTWLASAHFRAGQAVYPVGPNPGIGEIYYPPLYVELTSPLGLLPWPVFAILARLVEFLALRGLAGSWRATGIWLLYPPVLMEVNIANIVLVTALGTSLALRGRPGLLPIAALPKFAPGLALPAVWFLSPARMRRRLIAAAVLLVAAAAASFAIDPALWSAWASAVAHLRQYGDEGVQTGFDSGFFPRLAIAIALAGIAAWRRWPLPRTAAFLATLVGLPALRAASFAMLAGVPLLLRRDLLALSGAQSAVPPAGRAESRTNGLSTPTNGL